MEGIPKMTHQIEVLKCRMKHENGSEAAEAGKEWGLMSGHSQQLERLPDATASSPHSKFTLLGTTCPRWASACAGLDLRPRMQRLCKRRAVKAKLQCNCRSPPTLEGHGDTDIKLPRNTSKCMHC